MRTCTVELGGRAYEVKALPFRKNQAWRRSLSERFESVVRVLEGGPDVEVTDLRGIGRLVREVRDLAVTSTDLMLDLVCQYAPEIAQDVERIEEEAYDEEIAQAFLEVCKIAFPFGKVMEMARGLSGPRT